MRAATDKRSSPVERVDPVANDWPLKQRLGPLKSTDKRSSPVERVDQVANDWPLKQRLGPLKSRNNFYENPLVPGYCQFTDNSLKWFLALKDYSLKDLNIPTRTHRQALEMHTVYTSFVCP